MDAPLYNSLITNVRDPSRADRSLGWATLMTALLVFPLVWMGGLVTSHSAGMSVPDWPNSYGYNMFALPFGHWMGKYAGGTFYEHSHRLLGTLVGLSAFVAAMITWGPSRTARWRSFWRYWLTGFGVLFVITLVASMSVRKMGLISEETYKNLTHVFSGAGSLAVAGLVMWGCRQRDPLHWRRWLVTAALGAVTIQGIMGGARVTEISLLLAKVHGIFGQLVFAFTSVVALMCSRWWFQASRMQWHRGRAIKFFAATALVLLATQLLLGALMRHDPGRVSGSADGLAIPDWPLHYGKVIPPINVEGLSKINDHRRWDLNVAPTTLGKVWLQFAHRVIAYSTAIWLIMLAVVVFRRYRSTAMVWVCSMLVLLVLAQVTLGVLTVLWRKPADIATMHQAGGALLLTAASLLLAQACRLYSLEPKPAEAQTVSAGASLLDPSVRAEVS